MHYTSGQLPSVSDSYGRTLTFGYSSGLLLTGLTTPDHARPHLRLCGVFSSANRLSTVTYNTSPATHQTYLYGNASFPSR